MTTIGSLLEVAGYIVTVGAGRSVVLLVFPVDCEGTGSVVAPEAITVAEPSVLVMALVASPATLEAEAEAEAEGAVLILASPRIDDVADSTSEEAELASCRIPNFLSNGDASEPAKARSGMSLYSILFARYNRGLGQGERNIDCRQDGR